jgi:hypothetical protein
MCKTSFPVEPTRVLMPVERLKDDAALVQILNRLHQMFERSAEAIEPERDQRVTLLKLGEEVGQHRAIVACTGGGFDVDVGRRKCREREQLGSAIWGPALSS